MAGLSFGIGGTTGPWGSTTGSRGGAVGSGLVFDSPITGDQASLSSQIQDFPSTWVIAGAFIAMAVIYAHWLAY
jgi:hypothetical protein